MNADMQELLNLLKSKDLKDRKAAIEGLQTWNEGLEIEECIILLEEAAKIEPLCDDEWDNPSEALVNAACLSMHEEFLPIIEKNIHKYTFSAINRVVTFLLILGTEEAVLLFKKLYQKISYQIQLVPNYDDMMTIAEDKESSRLTIETLLENNIHFHPWYIEYYHFIIANGIQHDYIQADEILLDKEYIIERLQALIDDYQEYDLVYSKKFVYEAWKRSYLYVRFFLQNYLTLFGTYCTDEEIFDFKNILNWKDNRLRLHYIEMLLKRGLELELDIVMEILKSDEGANEAYTLLSKYKPEQVPTDPSYQKYFVTEVAQFHFYHNSGIYKFPNQIEVMGHFEIEEFYGDRLTYYILRYRSDDPTYKDKGWMRVLVGAYHSQAIPTSFHVSEHWEVYGDEKGWEELSYDEHEQEFRQYLTQNYGLVAEKVVYVGYPKFNRRNNTISLIGFIVSLMLIWVNDWFVLGLLGTPIWWILTFFHFKKLQKNIAVQLRGYYLDYYCFNEGVYVELNRIATVRLEKRVLSKKERFLFLPIKKWQFIFYDHGGSVIYSIPRNYLEEEFFFPLFKQQAEHLSYPPQLEWEQES